ncbi:MAG TPA: SusC/RagA family TonB-linked outer membrane protein [Gemmatimonadales bacterium]|nr:SusC/RagA family TonB-linked outer membrane protein [Gemmatimonadales bacterium]
MPKNLCLLIGAMLVSAAWTRPALAQRALRGTVTDQETGSAIIDAHIAVKGTRTATATTADGRFAMMVIDSAVVLDVRRIGYQPVSVSVAGGLGEVAIRLKATALQLGELVVTGQATSVSRRNLANDVQSVAGTDLTRTHSETIENALQGKVPGAVVTANSGAPGGGLQVRMRGVTSIFGRSQPLYVVDGVPVANTAIANGLNAVTSAGAGLDASNQDNPVNRISDINPSDIATMELLEGSSAAAIYGSSAANGVIVITTRHGTPGPARFSVSQSLGTHALSNTLGLRRFNRADAIDWAAPTFCKGNPPPLCAADTVAVDRMFQASGGFQDLERQVYGDKSLSYTTNASIGGGNENTQYFFSALNQHDNGIMYGTGYDKQGLRLNLTQLVGSKLQVKVNTNLIHSLTKRGISNNDNVNVTPYFVIGETPSFFDMRPDQNGVYPFNPFTFGSGTNLLQTVAQFQAPEDVFRLIGSVNATYTFLSDETHQLRATIDGGIDAFQEKVNIYAPATLYWQQTSLPGLATDLSGAETQATVAGTLTHSYTPQSRAFTATTSAGVRSGYDYLRTTNNVTQNLLPGQQNVDRGSAASVFANRQRTRTLALFGQEELLLLDERLFVSGGVLAQKSTNNVDVGKLFYYPKAAASYRWPMLGPFEELKLRVAYGQTGNEPLYGQKFAALCGLSYTGQNAVAIQAPCNIVADPTLHPERNREVEAGIDAGLLHSRLALSATLYQKNNTDLILQQTLAPSTGFAQRVYNAGSSAEIRNRGIDVSVSGLPLRTKAVSWVARVTFARNVGLMKMDTLLVPAFAPPNNFGFSYGAGFIQQGASPSQIYGRNGKGGLAKMGDYEPKFTMGFSSDITYKSFRLYGLLDWRHGGDVVNVTQNVFDEDGIAPDSAASAARLAAFHATGKRKSVYVQDASFLKLREVTLSYQLPDNVIRSLFAGNVTGVRLEVSGRNLATWSPYAGLDPEVSNFGNQNINRGQDLAPYPPSRSYFFTLAVDF